MIALYMHWAWVCPVTYIRSTTGVTNKKRSATAIMPLHKLYISHSFNSISVNSKKMTFIVKKQYKMCR